MLIDLAFTGQEFECTFQRMAWEACATAPTPRFVVFVQRETGYRWTIAQIRALLPEMGVRR